MKVIRFSLILISLWSLMGCTAFNRKWEEKLSDQKFNQGQTGCFEGIWMSDSNGHNGKLYCIIEEKKDGSLEAIFHAKYKTILTFNYSLPITAEKLDDGYKLRGAADIGAMYGGWYSFDGLLKERSLNARYHNEYDKGYFKMMRKLASNKDK